MLQNTEEQSRADAQEVQGAVREFTGDDSIIVLPSDIPEEGKVGFVVFKQYQEKGKMMEKSFCVHRTIGPPADEVLLESAVEFKAAIDDAVSKDFPVEPCDDIPMLRRGVIVTRHSGRILYRIDAKRLRETGI